MIDLGQFLEGDEVTVTLKGKLGRYLELLTEYADSEGDTLYISGEHLAHATSIERAPVELIEGELYVDANGNGWHALAGGTGALWLDSLTDHDPICIADIPTKAPGLRRAKLTPA